MSGAEPKILADAAARHAIVHDLETTLIVEAAAGTGKTTALVARVIALLRTGKAQLSGFVAVTFMEKAAGEMKLRLRAELEAALASETLTPTERSHLERALEELETALITTIHALCADILRERPVEAGVDPRFEVTGSGERATTFRRAFDSWFRGALADPPEGVRRFLRRPAKGRADAGPRGRLQEAAWKTAEWRDFKAPWRRNPWDRTREIDALLPRLRELREYTEMEPLDRGDYLLRNLTEVRRVIDEIDARESVKPAHEARDDDGIEAELCRLSTTYSWRFTGYHRLFTSELERAGVVEHRNAVKAELEAFAQSSEADLAAALRHDLRGVVDAYEQLKERTGELDFADLLGRVAGVLRSDASLREKLQRRFTHIFIDEFQDTDPLQSEIALLLASDNPRESDPWRVRVAPGKLFIVGDPKQSVYRFRRADIALYESVKAQLLLGGARLLHLSTSFRGVRSIQVMVNAAFTRRMTGGSQASYVALSDYRSDPVPEDNAPPPIVLLPAPEPYGFKGKITNDAISRSLPDAVGAWVAWVCQESGWTVLEEERRVPVEARHICLLFRRFQSFGADLTGVYGRALEARGVPHVLIGGSTFHDRDEVQSVRTALTAIEWPDDELSVYATLRGPLFAIEDSVLFAWRHHVGALDPAVWRRGPDGSETIQRARYDALQGDERAVLSPVADGLETLGRLHAARNRVPIADTIHRLLEAVRAHAGMAIAHGGERALANVLRLASVAREFEAEGATSFRAFVKRLDEEAERGAASEAPAVEEGTDGVRIITAHKAKGLEFPIVVLCDPTAPRHHARPGLWIDAEAGLWAAPLDGLMPLDLLEHSQQALDRDAEEADRLAYVAATRARDCLVLPVCGDDPITGWFEALNPAIYPPPARRRDASPVPFADWAGDDTVIGRTGQRSDALRAGLHHFDGYDVVVWSPAALRLTANTPVGIAHQDALAEGGAAAAGRDAYSDFLLGRYEAIRTASRCAFPAKTVTQLVHGRPDPADEDADDPATTPQVVPTVPTPRRVAVERTTDARPGRAHGKAFGTLVHAILERIALDADGEAVLHEARIQGRLSGAAEADVLGAVSAVLAALDHPWLKDARTAANVLREHPVAFSRDGILIEGVIDLLIDLGPLAGFRVIDFKTDQGVSEETRRAYEAQAGLYADAVTAATGRPAEPALLFV